MAFRLKIMSNLGQPCCLFPLLFGQLFPSMICPVDKAGAEMTNSLDNRAALLRCFPVAGLHYSLSCGLCERDDLRALTRWHDVPVARCVFGFHELTIMREQHVAAGMAHFESEGRCVLKFREVI
jgi:hypothetical protein